MTQPQPRSEQTDAADEAPSTSASDLDQERRTSWLRSAPGWAPPPGRSLWAGSPRNRRSLTSGATGARGLGPPPGEMGHRWSPRRLVMIGASAPATFAPGQGWSYTNTGYVLLGMIVERATGKPIEAKYQSTIFGPLGLHATRLPTAVAMPAPYSRGYGVMGGSSWPSDVTATSPTIAWTAGGIVSTPGDLATFMRALLAGRLLPPAVLREMKLPTPGSLNGTTALEGGGIGSYGLGLVHYTWSHACGVWGHSGDFPGYHTLVLSSGDGKRGAAMYVNSDALAPPGALATLEAERLLACRMRFGR